MRAYVTGGSGFIGLELVRQLRARGDEVVAMVRQASRGDRLRELGCELLEGDVATMAHDALTNAIRDCDAAFHLAGTYRIGIPASAHAAMYATNVVATEHVLDAAISAGVPRIIHLSTGNLYGGKHRQIVDETYRRPQPPVFLSYYDETKYLAHVAAEERIAAGAPIMIAMLGTVYGPGDPSQLGEVVAQAMDGTLPAVTFPDLGLNMVHVEDVAAGILLVHDRGRIGESYNLGGVRATVREVVRLAAAVGGHRPPRLTIPTWLLRAISPLGVVIAPVLGVAPNLREVIRAADRVSYGVSDVKARSELGYATRDLDAGLRTLLSSS
jgi:nucleoside-diphosphate-sugar epimerase